MNLNEPFFRVSKVISSISSIWGKIEEKRDQRKLPKYKHWSVNIDKKVAQALPLLKALVECSVTIGIGINGNGSINDPHEQKHYAYTHPHSTLGKDRNALKMPIIEKLLPILSELSQQISITTFKHDTPSLIASGPTSPHTSTHHTSSTPNNNNNNNNGNNNNNNNNTNTNTTNNTNNNNNTNGVTNGKDFHAKGDGLNYADPVRNSLLNLWGGLLEVVDVGAMDSIVDKESTLSSVVCGLILQILKRKEFEPTQMHINLNNPSDIMVDAASRYRALLYHTQITVGTRISSPLPPSSPFHLFCAKVLAVTFFRVPIIGQCIMSAVVPDQSLLQDILPILPPFGQNPTDDIEMQTYTNNFPVLFGWPQFHFSVTELRPDGMAEKLADSPKGWLSIIAKRESIFFSFFREWILYIRSVVCGIIYTSYSSGAPGSTWESVDFNWRAFPGFVSLLHALLLDMRTKDQGPPPILRPSPLLELQYLILLVTKGEALNSFVRTIFLHTNAHDLIAVSTTLSLVEAWLREMMAQGGEIPRNNFDVNFFCEGLHIIISGDHHQMVGRVLQLIYNFSDMFVGESRNALFGDLLLKRHFFSLFLHWDPSVRNAFHQVLIFRMVRIKRSLLFCDGFVVREYGKRRHGSSDRGSVVGINSIALNGHSDNNSEPPITLTQNGNTTPQTPTFEIEMNTPSNHNSNISINTETLTLANSDSPPNPNSVLSNIIVSPTPSYATQTSSTSSQGETTLTRSPSPPLTPHPPTRPRPSTLLENEETTIDVNLYLKLDSYVKLVGDQIRDHTLQHYPSLLEAYVPAALAEYNTYLSRYYSWEQSGINEPPRLTPLSVMGNKLDA